MKRLNYIFILIFIVGSIQLSAQQIVLDVPYVPTPQKVVEGMLDLAKVSKGDVVYDLGCGDGRIVITAAKDYGATGIGVDLNPERIKEANENAIKAINEDGSINIKDATFIDKNYDEKYNKYSVENGNMIFAMSGNTIGKLGIVSSAQENILINQRVLIIKTNIDSLAYPYFTIKDRNIQNHIFINDNSIKLKVKFIFQFGKFYKFCIKIYNTIFL